MIFFICVFTDAGLDDGIFLTVTSVSSGFSHCNIESYTVFRIEFRFVGVDK